VVVFVGVKVEVTVMLGVWVIVCVVVGVGVAHKNIEITKPDKPIW
jgi:uncharacterized membrane protein